VKEKAAKKKAVAAEEVDKPKATRGKAKKADKEEVKEKETKTKAKATKATKKEDKETEKAPKAVKEKKTKVKKDVPGRDEFMASRVAVPITIGDITLSATPKEFAAG